MVSRHSRYFFDLEGPDASDNYADHFGTPLPGDDAAMNHAKRVIKDLKEAGGYDDPAWHMVVKDENGDIVFWVPFRDAPPAKIVTAVASIVPFSRRAWCLSGGVGTAGIAACIPMGGLHPVSKTPS
jgi:hypothetical protein